MKTIYKLLQFSAPLALAVMFSFTAEASAINSSSVSVGLQQEIALNGGGENSKGSSDAKAEKTKTLKPKKVKQYRTNHGPRKPLYPQIHRKKDKLSRARYLNAQR